MTGAIRAAAVILVVALGWSARADHKAAERFFRAGTKAYQAQRFLDAAQNFEQAFKEFEAPEIAFSVAQAYRRQYRVDPSNADYLRLSVKYYKIYLAQVKSGGRLGDATESLREMERELDKLGASMKTVAPTVEATRLVVSVVFADKQVSGAMHEVEDRADTTQSGQAAAIAVKALIDGNPVTPDAFNPITAGDHVVRGEADGYFPLEKNVHMVAGATQNIELELQPLPARVNVITEAGAKISVDGRTVGTAPTGPIALAAGKHLITVLRTGRQATGTEIITTRAEHKTIELALQKSWKRKTVPYVLVVAGGLATFTGLTGLVAWHYDRDAGSKLAQLRDQGDQDPSVLDAYNSSRDRRDKLETGMWVTGGAALVVAAMGLGLYYFDHPSSENVQITPVVSGNTAGAMAVGRF